MQKFKIVAAAGTAIAALTFLNGAAVAQVAPTSGMRLGEQVHAPVGFLDMCRRTPSECLQPGTSTEHAQDLSKEFGRMYWRAVFGRPIEAPAAAPPNAPLRLTPARLTPVITVAPPVAPVSTNTSTLNPHAAWQRRQVHPVELSNPNPSLGVAPQQIDVTVMAVDPSEDIDEILAPIAQAPLQDASMLQGAVLTWKPTPLPVVENAADIAPPKRRQETLTVDKAAWAQLNAVNRNVNRAIRHTPDAKQYGREDYWAIPTGREARGDCEDYVLTKRSALINAGVDPDTLSIAIVRTRWGELHAVLLVATDRGELVLDNLSPWIRRWDTVDYDWLERQVGSDLLTWRAVASAGAAEARAPVRRAA